MKIENLSYIVRIVNKTIFNATNMLVHRDIRLRCRKHFNFSMYLNRVKILQELYLRSEYHRGPVTRADT